MSFVSSSKLQIIRDASHWCRLPCRQSGWEPRVYHVHEQCCTGIFRYWGKALLQVVLLNIFFPRGSKLYYNTDAKVETGQEQWFGGKLCCRASNSCWSVMIARYFFERVAKVINTPNATHMKKTRQGKHKLDGASPFNQISARYQLWKMTFRQIASFIGSRISRGGHIYRSRLS